MNDQNPPIYSLDDLMRKQPQAPTSLMNEAEAFAVTRAEINELTPEDRQKVEDIQNSLDLRDSQTATLFGSVAQKNMADFSDSILSQVKSRDAGDVGDLLTNLLVQVRNSKPEDKQNFLEKLFHSNKSKVERFLASYDSLAENIDQIANQLQSEQKDLMKQVTIFDQLYQMNLNQYRDLELYIRAGENKVKEMREVALPQLYEEAKSSTNPMALQLVGDLEANVNRFERKIHELKISQTLALQTAPQIKLIQNNDQLLVDKINDVINHTLPLWRSQTVIALGLAKQESVLEMQKDISETTNELIRDNAQKLKQTSLGVKEESERSLVDIESLEKANQDLIDTIKGSLEISRQAKTQRQDAEEKMIKIKEDLKAALKEAIEEDESLRQ